MIDLCSRQIVGWVIRNRADTVVVAQSPVIDGIVDTRKNTTMVRQAICRP